MKRRAVPYFQAENNNKHTLQITMTIIQSQSRYFEIDSNTQVGI